MPSTDVSLSLLDRYLTGECSADEAEMVRQWLGTQPDHLAELKLLNEIRSVAARTPVWDVRGMWRHTKQEMAAQRLASTGEVPSMRLQATPPSSTPRLWRALRYTFAGAMAGVVVLVLGWQVIAHRTAVMLSANVTTYTTANGEQSKIILPDGSTAILNVASRLEIPANYTMGHRVLHLDGEAFFSVAHHEGTPLTIVAGASTTRVLGTDFVVRKYPTDTAATIAVRSGKVMVQSTVVTKQQQVQVSSRGITLIQRTVPTQFSFSTGRLVLDGKLQDVIPDLNRWYDADIRLDNPDIGTRQLVVECASGSLADLKAILELALGLRVTREGRVLTLSQNL